MKNTITTHKRTSQVALGLAAVGLLGILATGCSAKHSKSIPEKNRVREAPKSDQETGLVVSGVCEDKMADLIEKNPEIRVRVINKNHCNYEVWGVEQDKLQRLINDPKVVIEKNRYVKVNAFLPSQIQNKNKYKNFEYTPNANPRHPLVQAIEEIQGVKLEGDAKVFAEGCQLDGRRSPQIVVKDNQGRDKQNAGIFFEIGQSLELSAAESTAIAPAQNLKYLWLITGPNDSALGAVSHFDSRTLFSPDATGMHLFSVIARDDHDYCQIEANAFYVTDNPVFKPENPLPDFVADQADLSAFWHIIHVGAKTAWSIAKGEGLIVGVIDSGVDYNHSALANNILLNTAEIPDNGLDDDNNGFVDDYVGYDFGQDDAYPFDDFGHGTHVAGIAASNVFGAARKARILSTKFGAGLGFDIASVSGAILYQVDRGAKILNMSFGWEEDLQIVRNAINYAEAKGALIVAAAGNETNDNDLKPSYPDSYPNKNILSIAATDENNDLTTYSNFGAKRVHLAAPGGTPEKPLYSSYKKNPRKAEYVGLMGTSMAAPLVAGVAAQVWSANPNLTNLQVRQILLETGHASEKLAGRIQTGKVVDALAAVNAAKSLHDMNTTPVIIEVTNPAQAANKNVVDRFATRLPSSLNR